MRGSVVVGCLVTSLAQGEEGYWPYSALPVAQIAGRYDYRLTSDRAAHLLKASARFQFGGSGSFVSANGLFLTNQHIAANAVASLNREGKDYVRDGFLARSVQEERRLPGYNIEALQSIEDITAQLEKAAPDAISAIEKECTVSPDQPCRVASIANGARYELHRYKIYSDVRLVFCPEEAAASFHRSSQQPVPGVLDAFAFDVCLMRVYEHDRPARIGHYLRWSSRAPRAGELVIASGFPIASARWQPVAQLKYQRDVTAPWTLRMIRTFIEALTDAQARKSSGIQGALNSAQAMLEFHERHLHILRDSQWMRYKEREEEAFKIRLAAAEGREGLAAFSRLARALDVKRAAGSCRALTGYLSDPANPLAGSVALTFYVSEFISAAEALARPSEQREERYRQPAWGREVAWYWSPDIDEVNRDLDEARWRAWFELLGEANCLQGALAQDLLAGQTPRDAAARIARTNRVGEPDFHKSLLSGDDAAVVDAIRTTTDPLISFARRIQAERTRLAPVAAADREAEQAVNEIARLRYQLLSDREYPDATNTLRVSYGTVKGYEWRGHEIPALATFGDLRQWLGAHPQEQASLPAAWRFRHSRPSAGLPLSLSTTLDICSGHSGSPIVDRKGNLIGVLASHAPTRVSPFTFDAELSRAIGVAAPGIVEVLRKVYGAEGLAEELVGSSEVRQRASP